MKLGLKIACLGGLAAVFGLPVFVSTNSAFAESVSVDFDCREGLTKKVVLFPDEDGVEIALTGCQCGTAESIPAMKEKLRFMAANVMAQRAGGDDLIRVFPVGGAPVFTYPIAPGENKDFTFYCYTPDQISDYLGRAEEAAVSD